QALPSAPQIPSLSCQLDEKTLPCCPSAAVRVTLSNGDKPTHIVSGSFRVYHSSGVESECDLPQGDLLESRLLQPLEVVHLNASCLVVCTPTVDCSVKIAEVSLVQEVSTPIIATTACTRS